MSDATQADALRDAAGQLDALAESLDGALTAEALTALTRPGTFSPELKDLVDALTVLNSSCGMLRGVLSKWMQVTHREQDDV